MKYSQYVQIRKLFESDLAQSYGYDINEWNSLSLIEKVDKLEHLNELFGFGVAAAGILGLGLAFRKRLISAGLKSIYLKKLLNNAEKFKEKSMEGLKKATTQLINAKNQIKTDSGVDTWKELPKDKKYEIYHIEKRIEKVLIDYISKVRELKGDEITKKIESNKRLSDTAKAALKYTWETLAAEVQAKLLSKLMVDKVIETPKVRNELNDLTKREKNELLKKQEEFEREAKEIAVKKKRKKEEITGKEKIEPDLKIGEEYIVKHEKLGGKIKITILNIDKDGNIGFEYINKNGIKMTGTITKKKFFNIKVSKIKKEEEKEISKKGEGTIKGKEI